MNAVTGDERSLTVTRAALQQICARMLARLAEDVEVRDDFYFEFGDDAWTAVTDTAPEPNVGSLHDDWYELQRHLTKDDRMFSAVDLQRLSAILRALSKELGR